MKRVGYLETASRYLKLACVAGIVAAASARSLAAADRMTLGGQLGALADEVKLLVRDDPLLKNQKLKFGKVTNANLPESSYELRLEDELKRRLAEVLAPAANFTLAAAYDYIDAQSQTNLGHKVVQISLVVTDAKRKEVASFTREINDTGDIARILGQTLAPPDSADFGVRNEAGEKAETNPAFETVPGKPSQVTAPGMPRYAIELRRLPGGVGDPMPVTPTSEGGRAFAQIEISDAYQVVLLNYDEAADVVARVEIDSLDAANAFNEDGVKYPGYFVPRAKGSQPGEHVVPGWLRTVKQADDNVFQFVVNELGKGAASAKGVRGGIGVVTTQFFLAYPLGTRTPARNFGETGKGQGMRVDYTLKETQVDSEAVSIVSIRYTRSPRRIGNEP